MTTQEIANRLVELSRIGQYDQIYNELFAADAVNIEPEHSNMQSVKGVDAIRQKGVQFNEMVQAMHNSYVSEPLVAGNHITLTMGIDFTAKDGNRMNMEEVCVYEVKNGKIVKEQFFF